MNREEDDVLSRVSPRSCSMSIAKRGTQTELEFAQRGEYNKQIT